MIKHLLEYIEIKDFKCFKNFKAEGFKRVNLIGGKNNVGKTAFMEACYINIRSSNIDSTYSSLVTVSLHRNIIEYVAIDNIKKDKTIEFERTKYYSSTSNLNNINYELNYGQGIKSYRFNINGEVTEVNANQFSEGIGEKVNNIHFISNTSVANDMLVGMFVSLQKKKKEKELSVFLNDFDNNIEEFMVLGNIPSCKVKDINDYRDINEFGDGLKHFIFVICSLYACENGHLFIDEIENGIHYSKFDELWEIILTISKEQNVQVFATTHSKECIESYARVSKKLEDKQKITKDDVSFIELGKNKENELKAMVYPYDWFEDEISQNHELRGW